MYLANQGSAYRLDKAMQTINVLMTNETTLNFFNENEIDIIVGCGLRELGEQHTSRSRVQTICVLLAALEHPTYLKHYPKRADDFVETLEQQIIYEEKDSYKSKERVQIMKLN